MIITELYNSDFNKSDLETQLEIFSSSSEAIHQSLKVKMDELKNPHLYYFDIKK